MAARLDIEHQVEPQHGHREGRSGEGVHVKISWAGPVCAKSAPGRKAAALS
jgi:hypothetical protein